MNSSKMGMYIAISTALAPRSPLREPGTGLRG
jgi:hypothetical protein